MSPFAAYVPALFKLAEAPADMAPLINRIQSLAAGFSQRPEAQQSLTSGLQYGAGLGSLLGAGLGGLYGLWANRDEEDASARRRRLLGAMLAGGGAGAIGGGVYGANSGLNDAWFRTTGLQGLPLRSAGDKDLVRKAVENTTNNRDAMLSAAQGGNIGKTIHLFTGT